MDQIVRDWCLPVVIDVGTSYTKAGYGGNRDPTVCVATVVNRVQSDAGHPTYPLKNGIVVNWSEYEQLLELCFREKLNVDSQNHPVLLTEPPLNPPENREHLAEIMFETFQVPALHIGIQAVLALYGKHALKQLEQSGTSDIEAMSSTAEPSTSDLTGTIIDSGDGVTHVVPIVNGYVVGPAIQSMPLAGSTVTSFIENRGIKEKHCYVCKDMDRELQKFKDPNVTNCTSAIYNYKDKQSGKSLSVTVQQERFQAPELYFRPQLANLDMPALPKLVDQAIQKSPIDARRRLYSSIWLSGGSTMFRRFDNRLQLELQGLVNKRISKVSTGVDVRVSKHPRQRFAVWVGGSLLSVSELFAKNYQTKAQYDECGPSVCRGSHISM